MNFFTKRNRVQSLLLKQEILSGIVLLLLIYAILWIVNIYFSIHRDPVSPIGELFPAIFKQCNIPFLCYLVICSFVASFQILIRIIFPRWNKLLGNIEEKMNSDWGDSIQNSLIIPIGPFTILDNWLIFQAFRDIAYFFSRTIFLDKEDLI